MNRPVFMGVVNVTPDSFSDGGRFLDPRRAIEHGLALAEEGAAILDIGGELTRPGAASVPAQEEMDRILPVIEGLRAAGAVISVDTRHAATMRAAVAAGAGMINDITALCDPENLRAAAEAGVPVCLMHMQGEPRTMQDNPVYGDVVQEVFDFLKDRIMACGAAGIPRAHIIADPGIGFGKKPLHSLALLHDLDEFAALGVPLLVGVSRKSFLGGAADDRLPGSLAAALWAWQKGATFFRVHDVAATRRAFEAWEAISSAP